jgi:hypothetical protein
VKVVVKSRYDQTEDVLRVEDHTGTNLFKVTSSGKAVFGGLVTGQYGLSLPIKRLTDGHEYTATSDDTILRCEVSDFTIHLPASINNIGKIYIICYGATPLINNCIVDTTGDYIYTYDVSGEITSTITYTFITTTMQGAVKAKPVLRLYGSGDGWWEF